jgi:hypothetical protein
MVFLRMTLYRGLSGGKRRALEEGGLANRPPLGGSALSVSIHKARGLDYCPAKLAWFPDFGLQLWLRRLLGRGGVGYGGLRCLGRIGQVPARRSRAWVRADSYCQV